MEYNKIRERNHVIGIVSRLPQRDVAEDGEQIQVAPVS